MARGHIVVGLLLGIFAHPVLVTVAAVEVLDRSGWLDEQAHRLDDARERWRGGVLA